MPKKIPNFTFCFSNPYSSFGYITLDGHAVDLLTDCNKVYEYLGYTVDMAKAGTLPDEFIWHEYTKVGAVKSRFCMQSKIIEYLNENSVIFRDKYGAAYKSWAGSCTSRKIGTSPECANYHMCPKHEANKPLAQAYPIKPTKSLHTPAQARHNFHRLVSSFGIVETPAESSTALVVL